MASQSSLVSTSSAAGLSSQAMHETLEPAVMAPSRGPLMTGAMVRALLPNAALPNAALPNVVPAPAPVAGAAPSVPMAASASTASSASAAASASASAVSDPLATEQKSKMEATHLNLTVKDQSGGEVAFKVRNTTRFIKLMRAYAAKVGADLQSIRFLFDGARIQEDATPEQLEMEDGDVIDAMVAQTGGNCEAVPMNLCE
jgi:hypothetical protein